MPSEGRRLHGFTVVSRTLGLGRQLLLPAVVGGASAGGSIGGTLQWILLILAVPSIGIAFAQWLAFRYRIEGDDLVIDSGVLARRRRVIPLGRVQNIDLEQSLLQRFARVAALRLETASGGSETEASLTVLDLEQARELQADLMRRRNRIQTTDTDPAAAAPAHTPAPEPDRVLLRLGTADLALAGATSNEAGLIAAGFATLIELSTDFAQFDWLERIVEEVFGRGVEVGVAGAVVAGAILAATLFVAGWAVSIVATVVRFHGFTLSRAGDDLRREYGLLSRHRSTVPLERVQAVRIEETLLRRPLGLAALKIETAGAGPRRRDDQPGGRAEAFVPLARRRDVGRLLAEVFQDARFDDVRFNPVSPISRRRATRRLAIPIIIAAIALEIWLDRGLALLLLLAPAWLYARAQYRARAWSRIPAYALTRSGVFTRITWLVPERKIQTLHLGESIFQRRYGLATVMIDTAAGGRIARVPDVDRPVGEALLTGLAIDAEAARRAALSSSRVGTGE